MEKYKIVQCETLGGEKYFLLKERYLLLFWKYMVNEIGMGYFVKIRFDNYLDAMMHIHNLKQSEIQNKLNKVVFRKTL